MSPTAVERPNLLFIMTDQHRFDYLGCAGADFLRTPNLDRLAARGLRFTNCFTNSPLCTPARIGLATGVDPRRSGALSNEDFLGPETPTYYKRLREHGYRVGCVGKLDLAKPDRYNGRRGDRPCVYSWGFTHPEEVEGKVHSLGSPRPQGPYGHMLEEKGLYAAYHEERKALTGMQRWYVPSELPAETFLDAYQGRRAVEWLEGITDDFPWHYFVSFSGPHVPHDPPRAYVEHFAEVTMPAPVPPPAEGMPAHVAARTRDLREDPDLAQKIRRAYAGYIELIDEWIGRMLDVLESRGELERTWIVLSADHGEMLGDLGLFSKSLPYEPSIHVPLIVAGPGVPAGATCEALVELSDIGPTLCELAGLPPAEGLDARSFAACLRNPDAPHRAEILSSLAGWNCIRTERYKLVLNHNAEGELYDLQADPHEERNLVPAAAEDEELGAVLADLRRRLKVRQTRSPYGPPRPAATR